MNTQTGNITSSSVTNETAEADTSNSPTIQPNTPQQPIRSENNINNNSPTSKYDKILLNNISLKHISVYLYIYLHTFYIFCKQLQNIDYIILHKKQYKRTFMYVSQLYLISKCVYLCTA